MRLELQLFGAFQATWDGQPITVAAGAARAVLAYLALEPGRPHRRELLASLLWPDLPQAAAFANLRQTLARLRRALPDRQDVSAALDITAQTLQLRRASAASDAAQFAELLAACDSHPHDDPVACRACAARLGEAAALYRGELLQGLFLAQPFEEWLLLKREQLHRQALAALGTLAEHHLGAGRAAEAAEAARRQIALSPWHEAAHRQLMRALADSGDRGGALVAFERCRAALRDELGVEPDAATLTLATQIRAAEAAPQAAAPALPAPLTPLVGREQELAHIAALAGQPGARLITVVGGGGVGKSRLALAACAALGTAFADGVAWAPLAAVAPSDTPERQSDALAAAAGAALGLVLDGGNAPLGQLRRALAGREVLLALDNCEHLPAAPFAHALLVAAPRLVILATSRAPLGVAGEVLVRLEGLPVPASEDGDPAGYAGVRLFLERARRHVQGFGADAGELAAVARLCRLLDGLPLGIELAARWVGHYTCDEIAAEIQADLDFLAVGGRGGAGRHTSLRPVFDYSWAMLRESERQALARLSVFHGSFDRAAARAVVGAQVADLAALVDASLLRHLGVGRYGFHELVRQFAAARCAERGEAEELAARHAAYYLDLLAQQELPLYGEAPQAAAAVIRDARDNLRQAWSWAVAHGDWEHVARCLPALRQYTWIDGLFYESAARVAEAAQRLASEPALRGARELRVLRGRLRATEAAFLERQDARAAAVAAHDAIALAEAAADPVGEAYGYLQLSTATVPYIASLASREAAQAIAWLERALALCHTAEAPEPRERRFALEVEAACLLRLSTVRIELREYAEACALGEQALALTRVSGDRLHEARALSFSAMALENAGRYEDAYHRRVAMLELARANGSGLQEHLALNNLSCTLIYLGDYPGALEHARAALRISGEWMQSPYHRAEFHHTLSWAACRAGDAATARESAGLALELARATAVPQHRILPLLALGDALGRHREARESYGAALALCREQHMPQPAAAALAGIARCWLAEGALAEAAAAVEELLRGPEVLTLGSLWEPLRIAETCWQVLRAAGDNRADDILRAAAAAAEQQSSRIADPARRRVFREDVPAHRAILAARAGAGAHGPPARQHGAPAARPQDWSQVPQVGRLFGRGPQLAQLDRWLVGERCRLVALLGIGGVGKTTLAAAAAQAAAGHFELVAWRSLLNAPLLDELLRDVLQRLSRHAVVDIPDDLDAQIGLLLDTLRSSRCLLVLDNLESIFQPGQPGQVLAGYGGYAQLMQVVAEHEHQSCVLLTSRERPQALARLEEGAGRVRLLQLDGLDEDAGQAMLVARGVAGADDAAALVRRYSGNPLALRLVAQTVQELFGGDIAAFLSAEAPIFDDIGAVLDQQLARLSPLEREIVTWLAIEREPVPAQELRQNLARPPAPRAFLEALQSLLRRSLVLHSGRGLALQNVVTEYLTEALVAQVTREIAGEVAPGAGHPEASLNRFALVKAQAKDYVRASQARLILHLVASRALERLGAAGLAERARQIVESLRAHGERVPGYAGGNILNLLLHAGADLRGADFSRLSVWQAYLQGAALPAVSFAGSSMARSTFTHIFGDVQDVQFDAAGRLRVAGNVGGQLRLWRVVDGQPREEQQLGEGVALACFSPDGQLLASGHLDHQVRVWELTTGRLVHTLAGHADTPWALAFSRDGSTLASGGVDGSVLVWDLALGWLLHTLRGHAHAVPALAFAGDGRALASGDVGGSICVWQLDQPEQPRTLRGHSEEVHVLAFDPSGAGTLASGSHDRTVRLWDVATGTALRTLQAHTEVVRALAISPDGRTLASGGDDSFVCLWDIETGQVRHTLLDLTNRNRGLAFSADSRTVAAIGQDYSVQLWSTDKGRRLETYQAHMSKMYTIDVSPDGAWLASGGTDGVPRIWSAADGTARALPAHVGWIRSVAWSPRGDMVASAGRDRAIRLWAPAGTRPLRLLHGHASDVEAVQFSDDGRRLVSAGRDSTVRVWDADTGAATHILRGHTARVLGCALSPGGLLAASCGLDRTVRLWDISAEGRATHVLAGHTNAVHCLAFSPDGALLASSGYDQRVLLWDARDGRMLCAFPARDTIATAIAFHPGGELIATAEKDHAVRLWRVTSEAPGCAAGVRLVATLRGHTADLEAVRFSPDGGLLYSAGADETIREWDLAGGTCLRTLRAEGPYAGMDITGATGLSEGQRASLRALGAIERA